LYLARAVQQVLDRDFETRVWDQEVFRFSEYPLESLAAELDRADFGIFVLAPADVSEVRGERYDVPRDNVVFELGLFIGRLGRHRSFIIIPRDARRLHLPSDIGTLTIGDYDATRKDGNWVAALGGCCNQIRTLVRERLETSPRRTGMRRAALFPDFTDEFALALKRAKVVTALFIHSRRWRENHVDDLRAFLSRPNSVFSLYLPNLANRQLIRSLSGHFDDGPTLPSLIADAYEFFIGLAREHPQKIDIQLFNAYPTYSFYRFDNVTVVALYPNSPRRRAVPSFDVEAPGTFEDFVTEDLQELRRSCTQASKKEMLRLAKIARGTSARR
jgi:hypothetical protein